VPTKLARRPRRSTASDSRQDSASPTQKSPTPLADEYPEVQVVPVDVDVEVDANRDVNTAPLVELAVQLDTTLPIPPALQPPLPPLPLSTPSTSTSTSSIPSYNPGSTIADPTPTPFSVGSLFQQIPLPPQPLWDWPVASAAGPSAYLTTTPNGSLAIDSTPMLWSTDSTETTKLWDDIDMLFNPGTDAHFATSLEPQPALSSGSRVLLLSGDKPMRRGVSLAEICESTRRRCEDPGAGCQLALAEMGVSQVQQLTVERRTRRRIMARRPAWSYTRLCSSQDSRHERQQQ
jgi:hypothetical protein